MSATSGQPSPVEVLDAAFGRFERNLHTSLPGVVVAYYPSTQTADVRPAVNRLLPSAAEPEIDVSETLPVCPSVPVCWPRGRGFSCVGTLSPGDPVLLVFCETDHGQWWDSGEVSDPQFTERHALQGAVAIPGLVPRSNPIPVPSDAAALASKLDTLLRALILPAVPVTPVDAVNFLVALQAAAVALLPPTTPPGVGTPGVPNPFMTTGSTVLKLGA